LPTLWIHPNAQLPPKPLTLFPSVSSGNIKRDILFDDLIQLVYFAYELKQNEINFLLLMILISCAFRARFLSLVRYTRALFQMSAQLFWVPVLVVALMLNAVTRDLNSLLMAVITNNISEPIYITWFDFGARDEKIDFWGANASRHKP
jgi:hypothetical protein